jgi:hypothetical protein
MKSMTIRGAVDGRDGVCDDGALLFQSRAVRAISRLGFLVCFCLFILLVMVDNTHAGTGGFLLLLWLFPGDGVGIG